MGLTLAGAIAIVIFGAPDTTSTGKPAAVLIEEMSAHIPSTPIEAARDELRGRFPDQGTEINRRLAFGTRSNSSSKPITIPAD